MNRRDFLKLTLYSSALAGLGSPLSNALAAGGPYRTLINIMCLGGADFRYMFAPNPVADPNYANAMWAARSQLYGTASYQLAWDTLYTETAPGAFGIHNNAGWLKAQYDLGNVAIICNVVGSTNRRHDQSQLIVNTGDLTASKFVYDRDGWGGRLAESIGATANVVAMSNDISVFCKGTDPANRNAQVIHARDTRNFALSQGITPGSTNPNTIQKRMARALKNYYAGRRQEVLNKPVNWPYHKFFQHEKKLREFGDPFKLLTDANPLTPELIALDTPGSGNTLNQRGFAKQCANIYDSFTGADLFKLRVASVEYGGWDNHVSEKYYFERNISDLFGIGKGLDTLTTALPAETWNNTVFVFTSDFGRQLKANGTNGTDHGTGNYMILVGPPVTGGVYGEMHPQREITGSPTPYEKQGADILGLTSFERVLARTCDWVEPGTGVQVFPNTAFNDVVGHPNRPILEEGVNLSGLFA